MRNKLDLREILQKNAVTVMFIVLCLIGLVCSGQTVSYVMYELFGRLSRNSFIVLALIIPIIAGMGINFAITIGAMAAKKHPILMAILVYHGIGFVKTAVYLTVFVGGNAMLSELSVMGTSDLLSVLTILGGYFAMYFLTVKKLNLN